MGDSISAEDKVNAEISNIFWRTLMEIMKLIPVGKDYLWGGARLREEFGKKIDLTPLAETWECSVHPDGLKCGNERGNSQVKRYLKC